MDFVVETMMIVVVRLVQRVKNDHSVEIFFHHVDRRYRFVVFCLHFPNEMATVLVA